MNEVFDPANGPEFYYNLWQQTEAERYRLNVQAEQAEDRIESLESALERGRSRNGELLTLLDKEHQRAEQAEEKVEELIEEHIRIAAIWTDQRESMSRELHESEARAAGLEDEIAKVHHWLLEMFEFFWHDGNSRTHLSIVNWLEEPHSKAWEAAVKASEGREMAAHQPDDGEKP